MENTPWARMTIIPGGPESRAQVTGTRKPVWRAFELLAGAGTRRLAVSGGVSPAEPDATVSVLATVGGAGAAGSWARPLLVSTYLGRTRSFLACKTLEGAKPLNYVHTPRWAARSGCSSSWQTTAGCSRSRRTRATT